MDVLHTHHDCTPQEGLRNIAFGEITDAVALLLSETPPTKRQLKQMNLYMISEIKRPKGGGLEIKFYDRLKALELLCTLNNQQSAPSALPLYKALTQGAQQLKDVSQQ